MTDILRILNLSGAVPANCGDGSVATFATVKAMCRTGHNYHYCHRHSPAQLTNNEFATNLQRDCDGKLSITSFGNNNCINTASLYAVMGINHPVLAAKLISARLSQDSKRLNAIRRIAMMQLYQGRIQRNLANYIAQHKIDIVQVDYPWCVSLANYLSQRTPAVFVAHEIQTQIVQQVAPNASDLHTAARTAESKQMQQYDAILCLSPDDQVFCRDQLLIPNTYYSPLTIPYKLLPPTCIAHKPIRLTFMGGFSHSPNADAVEWLCREIMPAVLCVIPNLKLSIIGKYPHHFIERFQSPHVEFTGFLNDFAQTINGSLFLCPLRIGSGMRIKILDAIAAGAAVVSTPLGARGLGLTNGDNILLSSTPNDFAQAIQRLVSTPNMALSLAEKAQSHIQSLFAPEVVAKRRTEIFHEVIERKASSTKP